MIEQTDFHLYAVQTMAKNQRTDNKTESRYAEVFNQNKFDENRSPSDGINLFVINNILVALNLTV